MAILTKKIDDESYYAGVSGRVVRDAEIKYSRAKGVPMVSFSVGYDAKKYMNCKAIGETDVAQLASKLENGDFVFCLGKVTMRDYTAKDGSQRKWTELLCDYISVQMTGCIPATGQSDSDATEDENGFSGLDDDDDFPFG